MWELVSFVKSGRTRRLCLIELSSGPKTPAMVAKTTGEHLTHISRALRELGENSLVECLTPASSKNRIYSATDVGLEVLERLQEIEQPSRKER